MVEQRERIINPWKNRKDPFEMLIFDKFKRLN